MKEAFEKIKERLEELINEPRCLHEYDDCCDGLNEAIKIVSEVEAEYINKSTEHINKSSDCSTNWIPCSERLPREGQTVLASINSSNAIHKIILASYEESLAYWYDGTIIAWQPLPLPYEPR